MDSSFPAAPGAHSESGTQAERIMDRGRGAVAGRRCLIVFFGASFERASDQLRISALLRRLPGAKVLSVAVRSVRDAVARPELYGRLQPFVPTRYEHLSCNFREERGFRVVMDAIQRIVAGGGWRVEGVLDYAFLAAGYYREAPMGYGMNWLSSNQRRCAGDWKPGKLETLFINNLMHAFWLPNDVSGCAQEMLTEYKEQVGACTRCVLLVGASLNTSL